MLSFAYKRFDGVVPEPGDPSSSSGQGLDEGDRALLAKVEAGFESIGELYDTVRLRAPQALREPAPLFRKLDESMVEGEYARLG